MSNSVFLTQVWTSLCVGRQSKKGLLIEKGQEATLVYPGMYFPGLRKSVRAQLTLVVHRSTGQVPFTPAPNDRSRAPRLWCVLNYFLSQKFYFCHLPYLCPLTDTPSILLWIIINEILIQCSALQFYFSEHKNISKGSYGLPSFKVLVSFFSLGLCFNSEFTFSMDFQNHSGEEICTSISQTG